MSYGIKKIVAGIVLTLASVAFIILTTVGVKAHSGRTDSNGGHNCNVGSCAGTYHYHNGGSSYTPPPAPDYITEGSNNGKAHALREEQNIISRTKTAGYNAGYSDGYSGKSKNFFMQVPDFICNISFTFEPGTNDIYKTWYKNGYANNCSNIARTVFQTNYNLGYDEGKESAPDTSNKNIQPSADASNEWLSWTIIGGFFGLPLLGAGWEALKKR